MSLEKAITIGVASNELSKQLTGSDEVSAGRTVVAVGTGVTAGAMVGGGIAVVTTTVAAPVVIPLAVASGICAGIASLFE